MISEIFSQKKETREKKERGIEICVIKDHLYLFIRFAISVQGSKGNVSVRFDLYGESFCFVNAHLVAGDDYAAYRNQVNSALC